MSVFAGDRDDIGRAFLGHHLGLHPVDATFMGIGGHDHALPRADRSAADDERRGITAVRARLAGAPRDTPGARLDARVAAAELTVSEAALDVRRRWHNPAWFTGQAVFGVIGLLLPQAAPHDADAIRARLAAIPDFLADGTARLAEAGGAPPGWVERAKREARAATTFLRAEVRSHPAWAGEWEAPAAAAAAAFVAFEAALDPLAPRPAAAGAAHLDLIVREQHGIENGAEALADAAQTAFTRLTAELDDDADRIKSGVGWEALVAGLADRHPADAAGVLARYRHWHDAAARAGATLVTAENHYGLDYRPLAAAFRAVAPELYFLFYRSPPPAAAGDASVYWVMPASADQPAFLRAQNEATIKLVHAVHHGSIGHHTHNARARTAPSLLGRVAGTDCAMGIAFLSGGTAVEGWACHAEDILAEAPGFYTPAELLLLKQFERRNAASVLVDVRLHSGVWTEGEAARFYREAGFPPQRVDAEIVRNTMFPGSRLMYWAGVEAIRALRRRWHGDTRTFHDALLGYGHVPVAAIGEEMAAAGQLE